jgi:hypothetical protein
VGTPKPDAVLTMDLSEIKGEEHHFIEVGNEICFYLSFPLDVVVVNLILLGTSMMQLETQQNSLWQ